MRRAPGPTDSARLGLYNTKSNVRRPLEPIGLSVHQDEQLIAYAPFELSEDETLSRRMTVWQRARAALVTGDYHEAELAEVIGASDKVIRVTLLRAAKAGQVERLGGSNKWRLIHRAG